MGGKQRQIVCAAVLLLAGCMQIPRFGDENKLEKGAVGYVRGFIGGVAADEPHAVLIGRDILSAGGSAADAATAMYFMLSVSYPSAAALGGGGLCLVRGIREKKVETLDFLGGPGSGADGQAVNVPGNPRGFFALHAKYGSLEWRELIRPAENAARFGLPVSRAFVREAAAAGSTFSRSAAAREMFQQSPNGAVREGDTMRQDSLSTVLASLRNHGGGVLYNGAYARQFAEAARENGAALTYADLNAFRPLWRPSIEVIYNPQFAFYMPMPRTPAGTMGAKMLALALDDRRHQEADDGARAHLLAEAIQRAVVDGGRGFQTVTPTNRREDVDSSPRVRLPDNYVAGLTQSLLDDRVVRLAVPDGVGPPAPAAGGDTSFAAIDRSGNAVACYVSMNSRFGTGRQARGTGVYLAPPAAQARDRDMAAGLTILAQRDQNIVHMAASASGGAMGQAALIEAVLRAVGGTPDDLETALAWKRLYRDPVSATTLVEEGTPAAIVNALRRRGHQLRTVGPIGRVNLIFCDTGVPSKAPFCGMRADPRGFGLASAPGS